MSTYSSLICNEINQHKEVLESLAKQDLEKIRISSIKVAQAIANGATIFFCGNGGSASDSQHIAAELIGRFKEDRRALAAISLSTDTSALTCIANDFGYSDIFSRQLEALGKKNDYLVAISTSGDSENVLQAIKTARILGMQILSLLGKGGGKAKAISDDSIIIPSNITARIQEMHILIGHIMCEIIEKELQLD